MLELSPMRPEVEEERVWDPKRKGAAADSGGFVISWEKNVLRMLEKFS